MTSANLAQFRSQLRRLLLVPALGFALLFAVLVAAVEEVRSTGFWVDHTDEVIAHIVGLQQLVTEEQVGLRGYLLTGRPALLDGWNRGSAQYPQALSELKQLVSDNPMQLQRLNELDGLYQEWHNNLAGMIARRSAGPLSGFDPSAVVGDTGAIRTHFAQMLDEESQLKQQRRLRDDRAFHMLFGSLALLAIFGTLPFFLWLRSRMGALHRDYSQQLQDLHARTSELEALLAYSPVGFALFDRAHRYVRISPTLAEINGIPIERHIGRPIRELLPVNAKVVDPILDEVFATGTTISREISGETPREPGTRHWLTSFYPVRGEDDRELRLVGATVVEITERKRAEDLAAQKERELTAFADSVPTLAWMARPDGYVFWFNQRWYEYTGKTPEEMIGWGWQSVHDPEFLPQVLERWKSALSTREPLEFIFPLRAADGTFRSFLTRVAPAKDSDGNVTCWFGSSTEIDELERTQMKLREQQRELQENLQVMELAQAATQAGFWHYNPANGAVFISPGAQRLFGVHLAPRVEVARIFERIHPDDRARVSADLEEGIASGHFRSEFRVVRDDGSLRWLSGIGRMLRDPSGQPYMVGINVDITLQKQAQEALSQSEKLAVVGRMAASISHEINNPLEAISNLLYLISTGAENDEVKNYSKLALDELSRITHIVTHTLRFNRQMTNATPELLSSLLETAIAIYGTRIMSAGIELSREYGDTQPVLCYPAELRQVFANLLGNAFDATRGKSGRIVVRTRDTHHPRTGVPGVRVTVADTGSGMSTETRLRLFEPFFSTKGINGTGLGLWVSQGVLEKHRTRFRIFSQPGRGTVFSVFFALDAAQAAGSEEMVQASAALLS